MAKNVCIEYVHIVEQKNALNEPDKPTMEHWKINIDDILNSMIVE